MTLAELIRILIDLEIDHGGAPVLNDEGEAVKDAYVDDEGVVIAA